MEIHERIKKRRKELGLSAETVAEKLNISPATMYRYENNEIKKFPIDILMPLANVLHTTPAYLMGWDDSDDIELNDHEKELVQAYRNRPDRQDSVDALLEIGNYSKEYYMAAKSTDNQKHSKVSLSDEKVNMIKNTKESDIDC